MVATAGKDAGTLIKSVHTKGNVMKVARLIIAATALLMSSVSYAEDKSLSIMLDWTPGPMHGPIYWAQKEGMFKKRGLDLKILSPSDTTVPLKLVATGNVDLAISYSTETILASKEGVDVTIVGTVIPRPLIAIMATASQGMTDIKDLRGKKVGYSGIPTYLALLKATIENAGLAEDDVEIVNVGFNLVPALLSGSVDAIGDGFVNAQAVQIEQQTGQKPFVRPVDQAGVPTYDENVLVADPGRLASNEEYRDTVKLFLDAFYEGVAEANKRPAEVTALLETVTNRDADYLRGSVPISLEMMLPEKGPLGCVEVSKYETFSGWMVQHKLIDAKPELDRLIDNSLLPETCSE